jgi:hypothetical protein
LEIASTQPSVYDPAIGYESERPADLTLPVRPLRDKDELVFELGLWLSGLECFLKGWEQISRDNQPSVEPAIDWIKEFRLTYSSLLICAALNYELRRTISGKSAKTSENSPVVTQDIDEITVEDSDEFVFVLRDIISLNRSFIKNGPLNFDAWKAWRSLLVERLRGSATIQRFVASSNRRGLDSLPTDLQKLLASKQLQFSDQADLQDVLARFAIIMRSLAVVGTMLRNDEPLKPSVLIFAKVHGHTQELISFMDNRLTRFRDEGAELFASLDSASYTASLELKKVYQQELTGLVAIRPAPSIHAKVETAYSLLNDSFEQILAGFARLIDPGLVVTELFPSVQLKLEQSLSLRSHLWKVLQAVKAAEQTPDKPHLEDMKKKLTGFMDEPVRYLFFKDRETLERFSEEIVATSDNKDLVPILHRFGAYLETLFSLVNMRTVLSSHPFVERK